MLELVLKLGLAHVIVATRDLRQTMDEVRDFSVSAILDSVAAAHQSQPHHPRPDWPNLLRPPRRLLNGSSSPLGRNCWACKELAFMTIFLNWEGTHCSVSA